MKNQACAIMRIEKLKSSGAINGSEHHNQRSRDTPNADIEKSIDNVRFIGQQGIKLENAIRERIGDNGGKKIRQSADPKQQPVLALEMVLTASPEYFRPNAPEKAGTWEKDKLDNWFKINDQWLKDTFGDKVVRAELHLDESTPHIHAYIVPMTPKGHLSANHFIGKKKQLSQLQTEYAAAMGEIGLSRGVRGSRAKHERIKDYYKRVEKETSPSLSREDLERHSADRQRQIVRRTEAEETARTLTDKIEHLERSLKLKNQKISSYRKAQSNKKKLRDIPLNEVAQALGLTQNENSPNRWQNSKHNIKVTGSKFYDFKSGEGGGGAIDLTMAVKDVNFQKAVQWLDDEFGAGAGRAIAIAEIDIAEKAPRKYLGIPKPSLAQWESVRANLLEATELPSRLIDSLYDEGIIYASSDGRTVFIERDAKGQHTGAMLMDREGRYARCTGNARGAFYIGAPDSLKVIIAASPIDAMAQRVNDGHSGKGTKYMSQGGATAHIEHAKGAREIWIAMEEGEKLKETHRKIRADLPNVRKTPLTKSPKLLLKAKMKKIRREISSMVDAMEALEQNEL